MWDFARQTLQRLASGLNPIWKPDGTRVAFDFIGPGDLVGRVYWQAFDGSGATERLTSGTQFQFPMSFSPDGAQLIFATPLYAPFDLGVISLGTERTESLLLHSSANELNGEISPDGRWLAYQSDESGQFEVYVRPFPNVEAARRQASSAGGTRPVWSRDGRELFYYASPDTIMAVPVRPGADLTLGSPLPAMKGLYSTSGTWRHYDVSADGQRFLLLKDAPLPEDQRVAAPEIHLVVNWVERLKGMTAVAR